MTGWSDLGPHDLATLVAGLPVARLQKLVQVFVLPIKAGRVDYVAARTRVDDSLCSRMPGSVVVEKSMDRAVALQERQRFGEVHHGIQHGGIDRRARRLFQSQIGKKIHEALEDENRVAAVVERGDALGAAAALETGVAELPSVGIVAEADGEIGPAADRIGHLPAMRRRNGGGDVPALKVREQRGALQRTNLADRDSAREHFALRERVRSAGWKGELRVFFEISRSLAEATISLFHDQIDDAAALAGPEIVPQVFMVVHMETECALLAQRRKVHAVGFVFSGGGDARAGKKIPNADLFYIVRVHCIFLKFSDFILLHAIRM